MAAKNNRSRASKTPSVKLQKWYKVSLLKRSPTFSLVALAFVLIVGGTGFYVYQATHAATSQTELKSALGNFCVSTNYSDGAHNGDPVNLAACTGVNGQNWSFTGTQIQFKDTNGGTGCAQPYSGNFNEQIHMVMATCGSGATQGWSKQSWGGIEAGPKSKSTGHTLCLVVPNGSTAGTPQLEIRDCNNTNTDQKWSTVTAPAPPASGGNCGNPVSPTSTDVAKCWAHVELAKYGWNTSYQFGCLDSLYIRESGWRWNAANASGAYGIPQSLPGSKMATAPGGPDWATNVDTQIKWGLSYIKGRQDELTPCGAWAHSNKYGWYGETQNADGTSTTW